MSHLASIGIPVTTIKAGLLDNRELFSGAFYERFALRHAPAPVALPDGESKNYLFPTLYGDVTTSVALFFCSYREAKKLMPSSALKPLYAGFGRAIVAISSYRYNKVLGMDEYNEVAVSILVRDGLAIGVHVVSMPVTTLENRARGHEIWGLPKVVQRIDLATDGDDMVTTAYDDDGAEYLQLRVARSGEAVGVDGETHLYSMLRGKLLRSVSHSQGAFVRRRWRSLFVRKGVVPKRPYLVLGSGTAASMLRTLAIEPQPFETRFAAAALSAFDLPE